MFPLALSLSLSLCWTLQFEWGRANHGRHHATARDRAPRKLAVLYWHHFDRLDLDALAGLFTDDAVCEFSGGKPIVWRDTTAGAPGKRVPWLGAPWRRRRRLIDTRGAMQ